MQPVEPTPDAFTMSPASSMEPVKSIPTVDSSLSQQWLRTKQPIKERIEFTADKTADCSMLTAGPKFDTQEEDLPATSVAMDLFLQEHHLTYYAPGLRGHSLEALLKMDEDELMDVCVEAQIKSLARKQLRAALGSRQIPSKMPRSPRVVTFSSESQMPVAVQPAVWRCSLPVAVQPAVSQMLSADPRISMSLPEQEPELTPAGGPLAYINTVVCFCVGQRPLRQRQSPSF